MAGVQPALRTPSPAGGNSVRLFRPASIRIYREPLPAPCQLGSSILTGADNLANGLKSPRDGRSHPNSAKPSCDPFLCHGRLRAIGNPQGLVSFSANPELMQQHG